MKKLFIGLLLLTSCSSDREPMDVWEQKISRLMDSDYVEFSHINRSTTIDGGTPTIENYLELNIYDSKEIEKVIFNDRVFSNKCNELKDSILNFPSLNELPTFHEIRINFIKNHGKIFKKEETKTARYDVD